MVRFWSILVFGVTGCTAFMPASAWPQEPRPATTSPSLVLEERIRESRAQVPGPAVPTQDDWIAVILGPPVSKLDSAVLVGMAAGTKLTELTLEQAYTLTLIRARTPATERGTSPVVTFEPNRLDEQANRLGADDFDRFRREFLSSGFHDPARPFFAVLKHRQAVDSARDQVALAENMHQLFEELGQGQAAGVSRLQVDQVDQYLLLARQGLADELTSYRSAADELKVSLGLAPGTPLVLDERILGPFTTAFAAIDAWQRNPRRLLTELPAMRDRLPQLEDLKIGGRTLHDVIQGTLVEEPLLLTAIEVARTHRPILKDDHVGLDDRNVLELRIRSLVRSLILIHKNFDLERRRLELALRETDQRFAQIVAPPVGRTSVLAESAHAATATLGVIEPQSRLYQSRTRLVALWLQFKEQGLALYQELGTMPYDNWEAFRRSFLPEGGRPTPEAGRP
jgi:hypothetical protein